MATEAARAGAFPRGHEAPALRPRVAIVARRAARITFGATIVLSPLRAALVLAARPAPPVWDGYTNLAVSAAELALIATIGLWLVALAADPRPIALGPRFLRWPLAALLALAWLGLPGSIDHALSVWNAGQLLLMAALALYTLNEIDSIRELTLPLMLMIGIQAVVGIAQVAAQRSLGVPWLGELPLDPLRNGVSVVATSGTDRLLRAYGLTDHPNILGGLLAFALPLVVFVAPPVRHGRVLRAVAAALAPAGLFVTFSRAAWLAAAIALAIGSAMLAREVRLPAGRRFGRRAVVVIGATTLGAAVIATILLVSPLGRFLGARLGADSAVSVTEQMSTGERSILVDATAGVIGAHPLTGTGLNTLPLALRGAKPDLTFDYQPSSVAVLDAAAELGILGGLAYAGTVVAPWLALLRWPRRWTPELAATSAALAAIAVIGLFDYYTWTFTGGRIWAWLAIGLWAGAYVRAEARRAA